MRSRARQTRENRTITVDFQNEATYVQLLGDGKAFVELVMAFILSLGFQLKHKATCQGGGCLTRHSHYGGFCTTPRTGALRRSRSDLVRGQTAITGLKFWSIGVSF
jgi:hypothetical protein